MQMLPELIEGTISVSPNGTTFFTADIPCIVSGFLKLKSLNSVNVYVSFLKNETLVIEGSLEKVITFMRQPLKKGETLSVKGSSDIEYMLSIWWEE